MGREDSNPSKALQKIRRKDARIRAVPQRTGDALIAMAPRMALPLTEFVSPSTSRFPNNRATEKHSLLGADREIDVWFVNHLESNDVGSFWNRAESSPSSGCCGMSNGTDGWIGGDDVVRMRRWRWR
jgi:hypothetical protein